MMKQNIFIKFICTYIAIVLLFNATNITFFTANARTTGDFSYKALEDNTIEITEYIGKESTVYIPAEIDGFTVSSIGNDAFWGCSFVEKISIPNSVINIGLGAFRSTEFFNNTKNLEDGLLYIDDCLINVDSDVSGKVTIKEGTRIIGSGAFNKCDKITHIEIPNTVVSIGTYAFNCCEKLSEISIPDSVVYLDSFMLFKECSMLEKVEFGDGISRIDEEAFTKCENLREVLLGQKITDIGYRAFSFTGIDNIVLPNSVQKIDDGAFMGCEFLQNVKIGTGIKEIGSGVFSGSKLKNVEFSGTENDWNYVIVGANNSNLTDIIEFTEEQSVLEESKQTKENQENSNKTVMIMLFVFIGVAIVFLLIFIMWKKKTK